MNERHLNVLKASEELSKGGTAIVNRADAEECVDMGLVEPMAGYPLTDKGKLTLKEHRN